MAASAASSFQITIARPSVLSTKRISSFCSTKFGGETQKLSCNRLASSCHVSSIQHFWRSFTSTTQKLQKVVTKAKSEADDSKPASVLPIDLRDLLPPPFKLVDFPSLAARVKESEYVIANRETKLETFTVHKTLSAKVEFLTANTVIAHYCAAGTRTIDGVCKRAFIAGIADDNGYGWAIAKSLAAAGAEILVGTWVPALNIFETSFRRGKFDESRVLPDGSLMEITKVYPLDAVFDSLEDVPEDIKTNKRYAGSSKWTVSEVAESVKEDFGSIDILVHSLANGPEVTKHLLETSRKGYLAAISASSYSYVSLLKHFLPIMNPGGSSISLTYIASERIIPGYGGGMSSAKAALESDTRVLAFEAGRKQKVRVNTISAGPLRSRAAKAIGFIDMMIDYSIANAPLQKELSADEVGNTAAFLASPLASAITGAVIYVDNGLNAMGVGVDSPIFKDLNIPKSTE